VTVVDVIVTMSDSDSDSGSSGDCGSDNWSTLIFQGGRMGQGKGVVASFWLEPGESRELELPSGWSLRTRWL
jgi:hypothetical protein